MPHTITEMDNGSCKNMVSNLPLLFAGGYPTSLEKITEAQLEKFIPFMVQCSLGYIQIPTLDEYSEPEWWPADLEFMIPFSRPKSFSGNWLEKMRELVVICYSFHKCVFLLRFCTDLASYEPATLRFINNYNSTTSLYQRLTNKLLVTFRNENMLYDQAQLTSSRKCLLPKQANAQLSESQQEQMVEPAFFDIYLCDDCDAELYSEDAYAEHERVCHNRKTVLEESDDDDVIFCGSEVLPAPASPDDSTSREQSMSSFLMNFNLLSKNNPVPVRTAGSSCSSSLINNPNINILDGSPEKLRRLPRRTRGVVTLSKCTSIPLSSPCGQFLLKSIKTVMSPEYRMERLERLERFCFAPALVKDGTVVTNRPKWLNRSRINTNVAVSFKRVSDEPDYYHSYKFPRRQLSTVRRKQNFLFYNKLLLNKCKPCAVILERLTAQEIENRNIDIRLKNLNITRTSIAKGVQKNDLQPVKHVVVDCIDLCSSDDETSGAGVSYGYDDGCLITGDPADGVCPEVENIRQLGADIANYKKSSELSSSATQFLRNESDVSSLFGIANSKNTNHSAFQPLTPSLHLFSSVHNTPQSGSTPALISQPSSINNAAASSTSAPEESNASDVFLSRVENLTEVKENRVNDWLNDTAISVENSAMPITQSHMVLTPNTSLASRALSPSSLVNATPVVTNNNGMVASKTLPSLIKLTKAPNSSNVDSVMRQRTVTAVDSK